MAFDFLDPKLSEMVLDETYKSKKFSDGTPVMLAKNDYMPEVTPSPILPNSPGLPSRKPSGGFGNKMAATPVVPGDASAIAPEPLPDALNFDPDKLKAERAAGDKRKNTMALMGSLGDIFGSQNGFGNYYLGRMNEKSTSGRDLASQLGSNIQDPYERQAKLLQAYRGGVEAKALRDEQERIAREKDPNSKESRALKALMMEKGSRWGVQVTPDMSAYEIKQLINPQKMMETEAAANVEFEKQKHLKDYEFALDKKKSEFKQKEGYTEGKKAVDKDYAKDYNDFIGGGQQKALDAINKLREYREQIKNDNGLFQAGGGPIAGSLPDALRSQESIARRDNIVSVANAGLKATFGGQLSDGERKALANEFYNDKLGNAQNLEIIDRKIKEMENALSAQGRKAKYYEQYGTLSGYDGVRTGGDRSITAQHQQAIDWLNSEAGKKSPQRGKVIEKLKKDGVL